MKLLILVVLLFCSSILLMMAVKFNIPVIAGVAGIGISSALMGAWFK